jgi:hypothetical protein
MRAIKARVLVGALAGEQPGMARAWRRQTMRLWIFLGVGIVLLLGTGWIIWQAGNYGWQTGDWERISGALLAPIVVVFLIGAALFLFSLRVPHSNAVAAPIRDLLARNDDALAPVVMVPPAPALPTGAGITLTRLRRLYIAPSWWSIEIRLWPLFFVACFAIVINIPSVFGIDDPDIATLFSVMGCLFIGTQLVATIISAVVTSQYTQSLRQRLVIRADATGISWQLAGRRQRERYHAQWSAVRSFSFVDYNSATNIYDSSPTRAFLVDAGEQQLAWAMTPRSQQDEYIEADRLTRLIVAQTGKPLRDLNYARSQLEYAAPSGQFFWPRNLIPAATLAALVEYQQRTFRRLLWLIPVVPVFVALFVESFLLPGQLAARQQDYFAGLAPQIARAHILYHDALTAPDGEWPVGPSQQFSGGAYQLTAPTKQGASVNAALLPQTFQNVAVAVTVRGSLSGDIGLVLRANGSNMLMFTINLGSDSWNLEQFDGATITSLDWQENNQFTATLHTGANDTNRLLALIRGSVILLYINGQLVDFFPGSSTPIESIAFSPPVYEPSLVTTAGEVGFFVADSGNTASFSDFTVYAVTAPPALNYV